MTRWKSGQPKAALWIAGDKIRSIQDQNERTHVLVNITTEPNQPWAIENNRWNGSFL